MNNQSIVKNTTASLIWIFLLTLVFWLPEQTHAKSALQQQQESEFPDYSFSAFFKNTLTQDNYGDDPLGFDIWVARAGVNARLSDRITANFTGGLVEPPDDNPQLVNAFFHYRVQEQFQLRAGQFLLPFGLEGQEPIFLTPTINRSNLVRRTNTFRMFRDLAVQASGEFDQLNYAVALANGTGANIAEQIDPKDVIGRIGIQPVQDFEIGLSGHLGRYQPAGVDEDFQRVRAGLDLSYESNPYVFRAEYIYRSDDQPQGELQQHGAYILGAYRFLENWQAVSRIEAFNPDTSTDNNYLTSTSAAINYYFVGPTRFSLNYEYLNDRQADRSGGILTAEIQVRL